MIKTIIFDFDDTLYTGSDVWGNWVDHVKRVLTELFGSEEKMKTFVEKNNIVRNVPTRQIIKLCEQEGYTAKKFVKILNKYICPHTGENIEAFSNEVLWELRKTKKLYIVSMSTKRYIKHYGEKYGIDLKPFKKIYQTNYCKHKSKGDVYQKIMLKNRLKPEEMLVIGDLLKNDVQPALDLGMNGFHFLGDYNQVYDYFTSNQILDCSKYKK